jgi:archaeosortase A (PGF-CTERM-specific)
VYPVGPLALVDAANRISEPLVWIAIGLFALAAIAESAARYRGTEMHPRHPAVLLGGIAWVLFGVFWIAKAPHFWFNVHSPIETLLSIIALPACLYTAYLLVGGRSSLLVLTRAVAFMGLIYLPVTLVDPVRIWLIELVATQTLWGMELFGYNPTVIQGNPAVHGPAANYFDFEPITGDEYSTYIVLACTGIGSIAIFGGLIAAVAAPLRRKAVALVAATGIIWVLNIARNVFVGLAAPLGWFDYPVFHTITGWMAAGENTSFFVSHTLIAQTLSVVALLGITVIVLKLLPEITTALEEALFVLTGTEYDLADALDVQPAHTDASQAVRTDGGDP